MADLFTVSELASYLQRDLDTATATLVRSTVEGLVRDEIGPLEAKTSTVVLPIGRDSYVDLDVLGPVTAVTAVEVGNVPAAFEWERPYPRIRLTSWSATSDRWQVADVTLTHGWTVIPPIAKAVGLSAAARAYSNPDGYRAEQIDDYSVTRAGTDDDLAGLTLTEAERRVLGKLATSVYSTAG